MPNTLQSLLRTVDLQCVVFHPTQLMNFHLEKAENRPSIFFQWWYMMMLFVVDSIKTENAK